MRVVKLSGALLVSRNEIWRMVQRSLEASGAPPGIDREGADAVVWLESRGLPGVELFARDLKRLDPDCFAPVELRAEADGSMAIACGGRSAITLAGFVIDYAEVLARAAPDGRAVLHLGSCRTPAFLVPVAARRAAAGRAVGLRWKPGRREWHLVMLPPGASTHRNDSRDLDRLVEVRGTLTITLELGSGCAKRSLSALNIPEARLDPGVAVDAGIWARITRRAARVLVPASRESRVRGAGGGDANL